MNSKSLKFIKENWALLLSPNASEFESLFMRSPLKTPWLMIQALEECQEGAMSLRQLSESLDLHRNTVSAVFRALEGKIFVGFDVGKEVEVELVEALERRFVTKILEQGSVKASATQSSSAMRGLVFGKSYYRFQEIKNGRFLFCDSDVDYVQISSPVEDPWGQEWNISFLRQNMKSSRDRNPKRYPYKLIIKLDKPSADARRIVIERRNTKGVFVYGDYDPIQFFGCPTGQSKQWVCYSIFDYSKAPDRIAKRNCN